MLIIVRPPSQWSANIVKEAFNLVDEKLIPVSNGVTDLFLNYSRTNKASNGPIVFFGRLTYTKGVDTLIEALNLVKERNTANNYSGSWRYGAKSERSG